MMRISTLAGLFVVLAAASAVAQQPAPGAAAQVPPAGAPAPGPSAVPTVPPVPATSAPGSPAPATPALLAPLPASPPVVAPLPAPIAAPPPAPVAAPLPAPVAAPLPAPVAAPLPAPVAAPLPATPGSQPANAPSPVVPAEQVAPVDLTGLLGEEVLGPGGSQLGRIVDVLADAQGRLRAVVVDVGGFMGVGNRKVAVAWAALSFAASDKGPVISATIPADRIKSWAEYIPGRPVAILGATGSHP